MRNLNREQVDELYMTECLSLAEQGAGGVSPNPMVGAVIVKNGRVIARGYHKKFGGAHAEVNAIRNTKSPVKGSTLYVNLEPCNHYGKTPPCTDIIIKHNIKRVVIGTRDPNPLVSGKGIKQLRSAGIKVDIGILERECKKLNEFFIKFVTTKIPFVTLKVAQTFDGKIADLRGRSKWITNEASRTLVHHLRSRYDAVLVGAKTVHTDNPRLTVRSTKGRNPWRVVLSRTFNVSSTSKLFSDGNAGKTIVVVDPKYARQKSGKKKVFLKKGIQVIESPGNANQTFSLQTVLKKLGKHGIGSVLVEGGAATFSNFIQQKMVDKLLIFISPKIFGTGLGAFEGLKKMTQHHPIQLSNVSTWNLDGDILVEAYVTY